MRSCAPYIHEFEDAIPRAMMIHGTDIPFKAPAYIGGHEFDNTALAQFFFKYQLTQDGIGFSLEADPRMYAIYSKFDLDKIMNKLLIESKDITSLSIHRRIPSHDFDVVDVVYLDNYLLISKKGNLCQGKAKKMLTR